MHGTPLREGVGITLAAINCRVIGRGDSSNTDEREPILNPLTSLARPLDNRLMAFDIIRRTLGTERSTLPESQTVC